MTHVCAELDVIARRLGGLWSSAMDQGDFDHVARLTDAGHAVQRAVVALESGRPASASTAPAAPAG